MRFARGWPDPQVVSTKDGCLIRADLSTGMNTFVYFLGDYEPSISDLCRKLVYPGDVCIDAGANFGWYSILFHKLAGESGEVHVFEPVPPTYEELVFNWNLAGSPNNLFINNSALAQSEMDLTINLFPDAPSGHASASNRGRSDATVYRCNAVTLDSYLSSKKVRPVDFVKVDIEGSELAFLEGAAGLFDQPVPPIIIMEMALNTSMPLGYRPDDLIRFIRDRGLYHFYKIDERSGRLLPIEGFDPDDIGANALCVPAARVERLSRISSRIVRT